MRVDQRTYLRESSPSTIEVTSELRCMRALMHVWKSQGPHLPPFGHHTGQSISAETRPCGHLMLDSGPNLQLGGFLRDGLFFFFLCVVRPISHLLLQMAFTPYTG